MPLLPISSITRRASYRTHEAKTMTVLAVEHWFTTIIHDRRWKWNEEDDKNKNSETEILVYFFLETLVGNLFSAFCIGWHLSN